MKLRKSFYIVLCLVMISTGVLAQGPMTLNNVPAGTVLDSILTINAGAVRKIPTSVLLGAVSATAPIEFSGGVISMPQAGPGSNGYLSRSDWGSFNSKVNSYVPSGNFVAKFSSTLTNTVTNSLLFDNGTSVGVNTMTFNSTNPETFLVNAGTTSSVNAMVARGSINNYLQFNIQNTSTGTAASSDIVATADNGNETSNYVNMGINGSAYTGGVMGSANDAYLFNIGQNLLLGTGSASKSLVFMTGGTTQATNERMRIDGSGNVGIGLTSPSYKLDVTGTNPLRLLGVQVGTTTSSDSVLTITSGIVKKVAISSLVPPSSGWSLTGNAGTTPGTNYIGTSDDKDLIFKRNGIQAGLLNESLGNTSLGVNSLNPASTANLNTAIGYLSMRYNTTGYMNSGTGSQALLSNTTGWGNTATGAMAMYFNTGGSQNSAFGSAALYNNSIGTNNSAIGVSALHSNVAGSNGVAIGMNSQYFVNNTITAWTNTNTSVGYMSLMGSTTASNNTGLDNTSIGYYSLNVNTSGSQNTAVGMNALKVNTVGSYNTALGHNAMVANVSGVNNTGLGSFALVSNTVGTLNIASGSYALNNNTTGSANIAYGAGALFSNVGGNNGVAIGISSQYYVNNSTSSWTNTNTSVGCESLRGSTTASDNTGLCNTALGYQSLRLTTSGNWNTALGNSALTANTTGYSNTATGHAALMANTVGFYNTGYGVAALYANVSGSNGTALGYYSQYNVNNTATPWSNSNTSVGYQSLMGSATPANNTGLQNTAVGHQALMANSSGSNNTATGYATLYSNTTGTDNTAVGANVLFTNSTGNRNTGLGSGALALNSTGTSNTATGYNTLDLNSTGSSNTAVGNSALQLNTVGNMNTGLGHASLLNNTTGGYNVGVGSSALTSNVTGTGNVAIGAGAGYSDGTIVTPNNLTNSVAIGYLAQVTASNSMVLGGTGLYALNVGIGNTAPAYKLDVAGANPLRLLGVQEGTTTTADSVLTITSGLVRKVAIASLAPPAGWLLGGNSGTTPGTDFIGTTDNQNVVFKRNNTQAGLLGFGNTSWGISAINPSSTGGSNTGIGSWVLQMNTTGGGNTGLGANALASNTTGPGNTAVGSSALGLNTTASNVTALGSQALYNSVTGSNGVAVGYYSQFYANNTTTAWTNTNTSVGYQSLRGSGTPANNTGNNNTSLGYQAQMFNTSGSYNVAVGVNALYANTSGNSNVATGYQSLFANTTGTSNVATGITSLVSNTSGTQNTGIGVNALYSNSTGSQNTTLGYNSGYNNTTGGTNTFIGALAGYQYLGVSTSNNLVNATAIGFGAQVTQSNSLVLGGTSTIQVNVGIGVTAPLSRLDDDGSVGYAITTTTTNLSLNETHHTVIITGSTPTLTLPAASSCPRREYVIVNLTGTSRQIGTYTVFNGSTSTSVAANSAVTIQSNGTNWYRIQ